MRKLIELCDFCPCNGNRAVSVLFVRDPEGVLVDRTKSVLLYEFAIPLRVLSPIYPTPSH